MSLKLTKFSSILDDIGGAVGNVAHTIGNTAGTAIDAAIPGNQSFLHNSQPQPPITSRPQLPGALGGLGSFANLPTGLGHLGVETSLDLLDPTRNNGGTTTPAQGQSLQVGTAHAPQLQVATPTKPNGQPLTATAVRTPTLQVGNQQVAQSPTAVSGVADQAPRGDAVSALEGAGEGVAKALTGFAQIAPQAVGQLKAITPAPLDPFADKLRQATQTVVNAPLNAYQQGLQEKGFNDVNNQPNTQVGRIGLTGGSILTNAALAAPVAGDAIAAARATPRTIQTISDTVRSLPTAARGIASVVREGRIPLNQVGAIGRDINPEDEQIANKLPSPAPTETTSPTGVEPNSGATGGVGQGKPPLNKQELNIGRSLGMSDDQIAQAKEEMANLPSSDQMAQFERTHSQTELNSPEVNTARNPYKSMLQDVQPGDYGQAIANGQVVSKPIDLATSNWQNAVKRLNPDEKANFWKAVENPAGNYSPKLQEAISRWRQAADMVHGNSQALGGNTNYVTDYALHPWDLPPEIADGVINGSGSKSFNGLNNVSRKYQTIAEGEANGLKLNQDPLDEGTKFLKASGSALRRESLKQGLALADSAQDVKPHTLDLGFGHTVQLSDEGRKAAKGVEFKPPTSTGAVKVIRKSQQNLKTGLLSASQFHPINISVLRAAPTLAAEGHPVAAAKGAYGTFRGAVGNTYTDRLLTQAVKDGMADKAALIGAPYGSTETGGFSLGEHTVFGKQMPVMHDQVVRSVISDLEKKGIPLNSPQARQAGDTANKLMGFMNAETNRISPRVQQGMRDFLLAGQFTPSKFGIAKTALTKGGVGGSYARRTIAANVGALAAVSGGIGFLTHQKSDDARDILLRAIFDPAVPTPLKDAKGNTEKLRLPGGDTSDFAKLLGFTLTRGKDGHLGVNWKPENMPSTVEDYLRARLAPIPATVVKAVTNTSYSGKPLYDPASSLADRIGQGAASVVAGSLPIGLQGVAYTKAVKDRVPNSVREVLEAQTPGTSPVLKSIGSSFGLTPATDQTVGKGQQSAQYYSALDSAKSGLNRQEKDAFDLVTGGKKNPVTGQYDIAQTVYDSPTKANALLQNPKVLQKVIGLNQKLQSQGQKIDPLYNLSNDQITAYLQHETQVPGSAEARQWSNDNKGWYSDFSKQRSQFFDSLPAGDPNKPKAPIEYPDITANTQSSMDAYSNITDPSQKAAYLDAHPEVSDAFSKQAEYTNQIRVARGAPALKGYPEPDKQTQADLNTYNTLSQGSKSAFIRSHPNVSNYFTQTSLYGLEGDAALDQFKGNNPTQKELKGIYNVGNYDISKNKDGTYSLTSGNTAGGSGGSYGGTGYSNGTSIKNASQNINNINTAHNAPHINTKLSVKVRGRGGKAKVGKVSKPKTLKVTKQKGTLV